MHTHIHMHAYAHVYTDKKISVSTPQRVKQYHRRIYVSIHICMHIHIYMHIHTSAQPAASVFADVYVGVKKNTCVTYTPAHALVPKIPVPKCTQHSLQKNAHIYTCTHMHTHTYAHEHTHAFMTLPNTQRHWHWDSQPMHNYAYTYIYTRIYIHTNTYTHAHAYTYIHARLYTYIHTHTCAHTYSIYICTHASTPGTKALQRLREELMQMPEALHVSFVQGNQTTFGTSNARTSLYQLPETPISLNPPSPLPNIPQNSSRTVTSAVLLFHTDIDNRVHDSEEAPHSFTVAPCVVVTRLEGKQRCGRVSRNTRGIWVMGSHGACIDSYCRENRTSFCGMYGWRVSQ